MKKITAFLLILFVLAGLCACSGGGNDTADASPSGSSAEVKTTDAQTQPSASEGGEQTSVTRPAEPSGGPSAEPTNEPTGEPSHEPVAGSEGLKIKEYDDSCKVVDIGEFTGTELIIPSHVNGKPVTSIDEDALTNDTMVSLVIPWTVVSIGEDAFSESRALRSITFSEGLTGIGIGAFGGCSALESVTLPSTVQNISSSAFIACTALSEVTILGAPSVGKAAFSECPALRKVTFASESGASYSILSSTFEYDGALEEVVFAEGLETIGSFAFANCPALSTVVLPKSLKKIEASAFQKNGSLTVYYAGSAEDWSKITVANGNDDLKNATVVFESNGPAPVTYSEGLRFKLNDDGESYKVDGIGTCTDTDLFIPPAYEGKPVTVIGYRSLEYTKIKNVTIPDSVTTIESLAFRLAESLERVNWGKGLKTIQGSAFEQCTALTEAILPEGLEEIEANVFFFCSGLKKASLPTTLTSVGSLIFSNCSSLETVVLQSDAAVSLNSWSSSLESAVIIKGVTVIPEKAFSWCDDVTEVTIDCDVTDLGEKAFNYCKKMATITLPASITTVGADVFYGCNALTTVNYRGSEEDWAKIDWNENTDVLKNATIVFNYQ